MTQISSINAGSIQVVTLKSNPPILQVSARGQTATPNWTDVRLEPRFDPHHLDPEQTTYEFDFVGQQPDGLQIDVITPVEGSFAFPPGNVRVHRIVVYAATNQDAYDFAWPGTSATGTGSSFEAALQQAVKQFPENPDRADDMPRCRVVSTEVEWGGIAGKAPEITVTIQQIN